MIGVYVCLRKRSNSERWSLCDAQYRGTRKIWGSIVFFFFPLSTKQAFNTNTDRLIIFFEFIAFALHRWHCYAFYELRIGIASIGKSQILCRRLKYERSSVRGYPYLFPAVNPRSIWKNEFLRAPTLCHVELMRMKIDWPQTAFFLSIGFHRLPLSE